MSQSNALLDRFRAALLLGSSGDAMGYKNGRWEFLKDGVRLHQELKNQFGSVENINVSDQKSWRVSDDTVMFLATAEALIESEGSDFQKRMTNMAVAYANSMNDMEGRAPGIKCISSLSFLNGKMDKWYTLPYDPSGGGCGGSMRSCPIGLRFAGEKNRDELIKTAIESGRITHNHATGFMGALVSALFTSYALENIPPRQWGALFVKTDFKRALDYVKNAKRDLDTAPRDMEKFKNKFNDYLKERQLENGDKDPVFPSSYGITEREIFYKKWSYNGWAGASGDDSVIVAYDALLGSNGSWEEFANRGIFHGGDNDSTGCIGGTWFGAYYGFPEQKFEKNWNGIEYYERINSSAQELYNLYSKN